MNIEKEPHSPDHFETHHEGKRILVCVQHNRQCSILIEADGEPDEQEIIERSSERAFARLDELFDGRIAEVFEGLHIKIGDNLTESGGEAFPDKNAIVFDRKKMLMSLAEAEALLPEVLDLGDWTSVMSEGDGAEKGSCFEYNIIHEMGHILDGQTTGEDPYHRVSQSESPTKYGRQADQFSEEKDHEAFAEGFTYIAYGKTVSETMENAVRSTIAKRLAEIDRNHQSDI